MFCPKCGNEVQVGTRFCGKCGAVLNSGGQERQRECAGGSAAREGATGNGLAGEEATGGRLTRGKPTGGSPTGEGLTGNGSTGGRPAGGGLTGAETLAQARETGRKLGAKLSRWLADYMDTWRGLGKLGDRERYIWLGIHGGAALVLVCILVAVFAVPASGTGGTARLNVEKLLKEVTEDGDITEEEVLYAAEQIHSYADWAKLEETFFEKGYFQEASSYIGMNFPFFVAEQCRGTSDAGMLIEQYGEWYDRDGLTEKITGKSDPVKYVKISPYDMYFMPEGNVEEDTFRTDDAGKYISVMWYACPDSDEITFVKSVSDESATTECYSGKYEIADQELVIRLDGKEYRLSQATADLASREQELFTHMAGGTWKFEQAFYDMIAANLGDWEKFSVDERDREPLYITFDSSWGGTLTVLGVDGIYLERIKDFACEQGEGKTVTFTSQHSSLTASYDKRGNDLVITVNGTNYVLSPTTVVNTGTYSPFGSRN